MVAWWTPPVGSVLSFIALTNAAGFRTRVVAFILFVLTTMWTVVRWCQYRYFRSIAQGPAPAKCLRCGYSLAGIEPDICPECGYSQSAELARAARVAGVSEEDAGSSTTTDPRPAATPASP